MRRLVYHSIIVASEHADQVEQLHAEIVSLGGQASAIRGTDGPACASVFLVTFFSKDNGESDPDERLCFDSVRRFLDQADVAFSFDWAEMVVDLDTQRMQIEDHSRNGHPLFPPGFCA